MIRVLIADGRSDRREQARAALAEDPEIEIVGLARDGQEAVLLAHQCRPDVALLDAELPAGDGFQTAERLAAVPGLPTQSVLLSRRDSPEELRRAMRAGAREHVACPFAATDLVRAVRAVHADGRRRQSPDFAQAADPRRAARVFAVSGAKGGVGKTTLAVNLAVALAQETDAPTCLVDLYTQFGDVALLLSLTPRRTLGDLAALAPDAVDAQVLDDCLEAHPSGLRILPGPPEPLALDAVSAAGLEHLLGLLKGRFRCVVLDVPPVLHPTTLHALSHATTALLVANLFDITTLHDTRRLLGTLEGKYVARERIALILNRAARQNRLRTDDVEETLGRPVAAQIPNDGRLVPASINQGVPFVLSQPHSAVAQAVRRLARDLAGLSPGEAEPRRLPWPFSRSTPADAASAGQGAASSTPAPPSPGAGGPGALPREGEGGAQRRVMADTGSPPP